MSDNVTGEYTGVERRQNILTPNLALEIGRLLTLYQSISTALNTVWTTKNFLLCGSNHVQITSTEAVEILQRHMTTVIEELKKHGFDLPTPQVRGLTDG